MVRAGTDRVVRAVGVVRVVDTVGVVGAVGSGLVYSGSLTSLSNGVV